MTKVNAHIKRCYILEELRAFVLIIRKNSFTRAQISSGEGLVMRKSKNVQTFLRLFGR